MPLYDIMVDYFGAILIYCLSICIHYFKIHIWGSSKRGECLVLNTNEYTDLTVFISLFLIHSLLCSLLPFCKLTTLLS
uniref:Ovule protein n=2 Tax=Parascaris TaxID=6254 RepID=A0A914RIH4_PAREQ